MSARDRRGKEIKKDDIVFWEDPGYSSCSRYIVVEEIECAAGEDEPAVTHFTLYGKDGCELDVHSQEITIVSDDKVCVEKSVNDYQKGIFVGLQMVYRHAIEVETKEDFVAWIETEMVQWGPVPKL